MTKEEYTAHLKELHEKMLKSYGEHSKAESTLVFEQKFNPTQVDEESLKKQIEVKKREWQVASNNFYDFLGLRRFLFPPDDTE